MKIKPLLVAAAASASLSANAGVLLSETFTNVAGLGANGWAQTNAGGLGAGWFQGVAAIMPGTGGAADSGYAAANAVAGTVPATVSDWLMTPVLSLLDGTTLTFDLRLLGEASLLLLDTVEVWASGAGASTSTSDFSQVATYASSSDTGWATQSLALNGINASGRIAFRYFVNDNSANGNYVGIDNVLVSIPEPGTTALVGVAMAGMLLLRRRSA